VVVFERVSALTLTLCLFRERVGMDIVVKNKQNIPFFWLQNEVLTVFGPKIGAYGLAVYCILSYQSQNSGEAKTSLRQIAFTLGISPQTAMRSLECLIENKLIEVIKKSRSQAEGPSIYGILTVPIGNGGVVTVPVGKRYRSPVNTVPFLQSDTLSTYSNNNLIDSSISSKDFVLEPEEVISPKQKSKTKEGIADPRHGEIRNAIMDVYMAMNKVSPGWSGREAKCLANFLREHPSWTTGKILECIRDRFRSDINTAQEPRYWIERLAEFAAGPLNAYGKPKNGSNGNGNSKEDDRLARARAAINAGLQPGRGGNVVHDRPALPDRTD